MTKKIELTPARQKIIQDGYDYWLKNGLRTDPADFDKAETAITELYASIGKKKPYFVRLSSPLGAELYINLLTKTWPKGDFKQLRGQLWGQLWGQLGANSGTKN